MARLSKEQLELCRNTPIEQIASSLGYHVKRVGKYFTIEEMNSIRIYPETNTYYRWSNGEGGSAIDFLMKTEGKSFRGATDFILDLNGNNISYEQNVQQESKKEVVSQQKENRTFKLPIHSLDHRRMFAYLTQKRKLSSVIVKFFFEKKLIYEEAEHHNIVFKSLAPNGECYHASLHGVYTKENQETFRGDISGSDKRYGFHFFFPKKNETEKGALYIFEAPIDLMSFCDLMQIYEDESFYSATAYLAQNGTDIGPTKHYLETYKEQLSIETLYACFDFDEAGKKAFVNLVAELGQDYKIESVFPIRGKDWNEYLCDVRGENKLPQNPEPQINAVEKMKSLFQDGNIDAVIRLLNTYEIDKNATDKDGETILHFACRYYPTHVEKLVSYGCNVNQTNQKGQTPLFVACEKGYKSAIMALYRAKADTNVVDVDGKRASDYFQKYQREPDKKESSFKQMLEEQRKKKGKNQESVKKNKTEPTL